MKTLSKLKFSTDIHASHDKVWKVLWNDDTYRKWTSAFSEGSYAVSDWKEGSKVQFLSPSGDGISSIIKMVIPNELMWFEHQVAIKDFKEQPMDDETRKWSGAMEKYTLRQNQGITTLEVEVDMNESDETFFKTTFPKALDRVKQLSEQQLS